jgi:hypothetical protein
MLNSSNMGTGHMTLNSDLVESFVIHIVDPHRREYSYEIHTAIILYNYGVTCRWLASFPPTARNDCLLPSSMHTSNRLFMLSDEVLQNLLVDSSSGSGSSCHEFLVMHLLSCLTNIALLRNALDVKSFNKAFHYIQLIGQKRYYYKILNQEYPYATLLFQLNEETQPAAAK